MFNKNLSKGIEFKGDKGTHAPTSKQLNTLRYYVYNYKINIKVTDDLKTRKGVSDKIAQIAKAINEGKVKPRENRPTNSKVKIVNNVWSLVQEKKDLNSFEHVVNGFGEFVERENERQANYSNQEA